jgi:hypothetical protein
LTDLPGKRTFLRVECDLTDAEIVDYCRQTATLMTMYSAKEREKKDLVALLTEELKALRTQLDELAKAATTGKQWRDVAGYEEYDVLSQEVRIYRCDTSALHDRRPMTAKELEQFGKEPSRA